MENLTETVAYNPRVLPFPGESLSEKKIREREGGGPIFPFDGTC